MILCGERTVFSYYIQSADFAKASDNQWYILSR